MKSIEERKEVALVINHHQLNLSGVLNIIKPDVWGDDMPIVRLGDAVGFVDRSGSVYDSVESAFVGFHEGCKCVATHSRMATLNKMATFLVLVALNRSPTQIAQLIFHGDMVLFETFSDSMEDRRLVDHVQGDRIDGYEPLELTQDGKAGLRMCLQSPMVDLPFDKEAAYQAVFPDLIAIELESKAEAETKRAAAIKRTQEFGLRMGLLYRDEEARIRLTKSDRELSPIDRTKRWARKAGISN